MPTNASPLASKSGLGGLGVFLFFPKPTNSVGPSGLRCTEDQITMTCHSFSLSTYGGGGGGGGGGGSGGGGGPLKSNQLALIIHKQNAKRTQLVVVVGLGEVQC
jgi:hypothetical protein